MSNEETTWDEMVEQCSELGLLAKKLYVVFTTPVDGLGPIMEVLDEHLAYQNKIQNEGVMFAAGPFSDDTETKWEGDGILTMESLCFPKENLIFSSKTSTMYLSPFKCHC